MVGRTAMLRALFLLPALILPFAAARGQMPVPDPGRQCRAAIAAAERAFAIPSGLMAAIGRVESGHRGADGRVDPWPWSIDAEGTGHMFASKAQAIAAVRSLQAQGVRSIDVGCMQVNLLHHADAFPSLDAAFAPDANATFAARFLVQLRAAAGSWPQAAALYHSATPALATDYQRKVMAAWPAELAAARGEGAPLATPSGGAVYLPAVGGLTAGGALLPRTLLRAPVLRAPVLLAPPGQRAPLSPTGPTGRSLAAYRLAPVPLALR